MSKWLFFLLGTLLIGLTLFFFPSEKKIEPPPEEPQKEQEAENSTASMIAPVEKQLRALKAEDLQTAYTGLVSRPFMQQTPFEAFREFVKAHPLLTTFERYDFKEHSLEDRRGLVTIILNPTKEALPVSYQLVMDDGEWQILNMQVDQLAKKESAEGMISLVREQLSLLQQGKIRQVYDDLISKKTQEEVPFETFQGFILRYPALSNHTSVNILDPSIEKEVGRLVTEVKNDQGTMVIDYHLTEESGRWKIAGMHISSTPEEGSTTSNSPSSYKIRDLIQVIEQFLTALREKDLNKAYDYTSKEFQYSNNQADFNQFFEQHPEFAASKESSFSKEIFNNAIATFSGHLILSDTKMMPVEFDLIQQEGKWKILHLYALPIEELPKKPSSAIQEGGSIEFGPLQLGNQVDDVGHILNSKTVFSPDAGDLYALLKIDHSIPGIEITIVLRHVESGSSLKPVTATLTKTGDETLTFLFSPPPKGWPKGSYQLRVSSSTQQFKTYNFSVE